MENNMKINKLKILSIAICCLVSTALWAQVQGMEDVDKPAGIINSFAGEIAPNGWLLCDGQQYSNQKYPELYEVVREKYVPGGSWVIEANRRSELEKYFCVPDLRGRVIVGVDGGSGRVTSNNVLGATGGDESVVITISQMPRHTHTSGNEIVLFENKPGDQQGQYAIGGGGVIHRRADQLTTTSSGNNQPHSNMQPYQVLNYIINTGKIDGPRETALINTGIVKQLQRQISELNISLANILVMPIGTIIEYSGIIGIPVNFLECNGAAISRVTYAQLFTNIGTTYGSGNNVTTFNLPDRRGRVAVGIGSDGTTGNGNGHVTNVTAPNIALGRTFGRETHTLNINEIPSHNHSNWVMNTTLNAGYTGSGIQSGGIQSGTTSNTGGSSSHNNMQPGIFVRFYIRAI
jgi:microcystin-dependent protein